MSQIPPLPVPDAVYGTRPRHAQEPDGPDRHSAPLVTIVTVAYQSALYRDRLFAALAHQSERRWRFVLWDNGSAPDQRPDPAQTPDWVCIMQSSQNLGFAAANNAAAATANTPFLAFLNPDAFPDPAWLATLLEAAQNWPHAAAFGSTQIADAGDTVALRDQRQTQSQPLNPSAPQPRNADQAQGHATPAVSASEAPVHLDAPLLLDGAGDVMHASGLAYRSAYGRCLTPPETGETFSACAAAMLIRRSAFDAVGGFDPAFFCYMEDVDLGFRLRLRGWPTIQVREAVVRHVGGASSSAVANGSTKHTPTAMHGATPRSHARASAFADFHGARNRLWTFVKNMPLPLLIALAPFHIFATGVVVFAHLLQGRAGASTRGVFAGLKGLGAVLRARRHIQAQRTASTLTIMRALAWNPFVLLHRTPVRTGSREPNQS